MWVAQTSQRARRRFVERWAGRVETFVRCSDVAARLRPGILIIIVELIALFVGHPGDANADQRGRYRQNNDAAAQCGDHARARAGRLGVAKGAALRPGQDWDKQRCNHRRTAKKPLIRAHLPSLLSHERFLPAYFTPGLMCNRRTLSDQNIFIISNTKIVTGIRVRNSPRFSSAKCMKYMSPNPALHTARRSKITTRVPVEKPRNARNTSTRKIPISTK